MRTSAITNSGNQNNAPGMFRSSDEYTGQNDDQVQQSTQKMDVTLIDAFKIKEINLLIASYIFAMCHNLFVMKADLYIGTEMNRRSIYYDSGSILGVMGSGILVDLVFKKRRFLTILSLNILIFCFDIFLFIKKVDETEQRGPVFMFILGAILQSSNLVYLVLIPMLIAKQHSEDMAENYQF